MTTSAGLVLFRERGGALEVLLGHMGGPYWARKDEGAWSIPKGELDGGEDPLAGARREFAEELGHPPPDVMVDSMRGRSTTWTRIRVNLRNVPDAFRPEQEPLEVDYDPWAGVTWPTDAEAPER